MATNETEDEYHEDNPIPVPTINKMKFKAGKPVAKKFEANPPTHDPLIATIEDAIEYTLLRERHWMLATMEYNQAAAQVATRLDEIKAKYR